MPILGETGLHELSRHGGMVHSGVKLSFGCGRRNVADPHDDAAVVKSLDHSSAAYSTASNDRHVPRLWLNYRDQRTVN